MSVNSSGLLTQQPQDVDEVADLYSRELTGNKTSASQRFYPEAGGATENGGGYRDWKAKNGIDTSARMVSSLGRALHNQGMVSSNDNYNAPHFHDSHSNTLPNSEFRGHDQHPVRHNSSEPYYSPQNFIGRHNSSEVICRPNNPPMVRNDVSSYQDERQYQHVSREHAEEHTLEDHVDVRCNGQCCSVQNTKSPMISPKNHQTMNYREVYHNSTVNTLNSPRVEYNYQNTEPPREPRTNHNVNQSPRQTNYGRHPSQYQIYMPCHPPPPPTCHCCQNPAQTPCRPVSPRKKSNSNDKSEASIKKLYRILWLQNQQLGLLERQVSKLIELNFEKESTEKSIDSLEKPSPHIAQPSKPETNEIGIMTDLPCPHCISSKPDKSSSSDSESESEMVKKSVVEESLTLNGVEIPIGGAEMNSPPVSMHIDLHDYQESSSSCLSDESDTSENESEGVGWTFYDNVVGQVNNMLKTAGTKKKSDKKKKQGMRDDIKKAVEKLKAIGLAPPDSDSNNPKRVTFEKGLKEQQVNLRAQSEVSMNFNALASKYLSSAGGGKLQDISMCNVISSKTNMSVATMRYLERHQLADRDAVDALSRKSQRKVRSNGEKAVTSKFLDITAIRQQPKLLPKNL